MGGDALCRIAHSSLDFLRTPVIDLSNLGGGGGNLCGDKVDVKSPLHSPTLLPPEAGLHWDGEQARLVEAVRRRQQVLQQRIHHKQSTFEWQEEMLFSAGFVENPRNITRDPNVSNDSTTPIYSKVPLNPYRTPDRPGRAVKHKKSNHNPSSTSKNHQPDPASIPSKCHFLLNSFFGN